jgi:CheY-like chemotaxis protein
VDAPSMTRVLVVDDDATIRGLVSELLVDEGYV